jgi:hypothetical protein
VLIERLLLVPAMVAGLAVAGALATPSVVPLAIVAAALLGTAILERQRYPTGEARADGAATGAAH